jgi:hypothetical protein
MGEPPAMTPPPEPPAMTPPAGSTWSGSPGSTGGETSMGGEAAERDEDEKL